jgi:hypothetical protein
MVRWFLVALGLCLAAALAMVAVVYVPAWFAPATTTVPAGTAASPDARRHIRATLFHVAEDGLSLEAVDVEVPYGATTVEQARHLVEALLRPAPEPYAAALAEGTRIRHIFLTEQGTAFVDLSREAVDNHRGGSLEELFSVYALVNTLTVNLPAIRDVQILVEGQEVDTLAGHVDLRHPLTRDMQWVASPAPASGDSTSGPAPSEPDAAPGA